MATLPPVPTNETDRLHALRELFILDSAPEPVFDRLTRLASQICGTPIALISLVDQERQWFKANVGLAGVNETPRDVAFCAYTVTGDEVFEVQDALQDPRFADNALVTGGPGIRFYAGAPLTVGPGMHVGSLCVIDREARHLSDAQREVLRSLAEVVAQTLAMRRDLLQRALSVRSDFEQALADSEARFRAIVEEQSEMVSQSRPDGELVYVNPAYARHFDMAPGDMVGRNLFDFVDPGDREVVRGLLDDAVRDGQCRSGENRMASVGGRPRWVAWTNTIQRDPRHGTVIHAVGRDITERKEAEQSLRASEMFLRRTGRVAGIGGWEMDATSRAVTWSDPLRLIHEVEPDFQPTLSSALAFFTPQSRPQIEAAVQAAVQRNQPCDLELPLVTAKGRAIWVRVVGEAEFENGVPVRLVGAMQDITERRKSESAMRGLTATLQATIESIPAIVAVVGTDERYRFVNAAFERWSGMPREQLVGSSIAEVIGPQGHALSVGEIRRALAGESLSFEREARGAKGPTHLAISYVPLYAEGGTVDGFVVVAQDISAHRREEKRLVGLAQRDPLTGLLNRAGFESFLAQAISEGDGAQLAVLYMDLDRFKPVNDTHGHSVGDQLLRMVAQRLQGLVRPTDAVARLGGDEFALVLTGLREVRYAGMVGDKIVAAIAQPFEAEGPLELHIGASVGVAFGVGEGGAKEIVTRADRMLYEAKKEGRGRMAGVPAGLAGNPGFERGC